MTYSKERSSFLTNKLIGTSTLWGGEKLGRPILSPLQNVGIFYIYPLDFWIMLFFCCIITLLTSTKQRIKFSNQWASPFFPPSLIFQSSIDRFVFRFMLLFHSILTFMKDLYQSENQVFNPTRLLVLLHCGVGKDWAGPFFPPSKIF